MRIQDCKIGCRYIAKTNSGSVVEIDVIDTREDLGIAKIKSDKLDLSGEWRDYSFYQTKFEILSLVKDTIEDRLRKIERKIDAQASTLALIYSQIKSKV